MLDLTKKTPSGGKVITLLRTFFSTSITCRTSPVCVPNKWAFSMMNSCSFSVVQSKRHVADSESPVVTISLPRTAISSIALMIEDRLLGSFWVLSPRSWSAMRFRSSCLADCDWLVVDEHVILEAWLWTRRWRLEELPLQLGRFKEMGSSRKHRLVAIAECDCR